MHIAVDISLYPLAQAYIPPIKDFIARLEAARGLRIDRNALSTQVSGDLSDRAPGLFNQADSPFPQLIEVLAWCRHR